MKKIIFLFTFLFLNIFLVNKSYASILFQDDFTDTDEIQLEQHNLNWASSGNQLIQLLPFINIKNNQAESYDISEYYLKNHENQTDQCTSLDYLNQDGNWFNLKVRERENEITFYMASYYQNQIILRKYINGDITELAIKDVPLPLQTFIHWKFCAIGNNLSVYFNGNQEINTLDSSINNGTTGFSTSRNNIFDNFLYEDSISSASSSLSDFKQTDPTWSHNPNPIGSHYINSTLLDHNSNCKDMYMWGCAITSVADVLKAYGNSAITVNGNASTQIDPGSFNDWMTEKNIFSDCGVIFQYMGASVGIANPLPFWINNNPTRKITAKTMIDNALSQGNLPIVGVNTIYGTHFIVLSKKLSDLSDGTPDYSIIDPAMYPFVANNPGNTGKALSATYKWNNVFETVIFEKNSQPTSKTISFIGHSPIQLTVTDPNGKQTGYQPTSNSYLNDIPESSYGTDSGIADILGKTTKAPEAIIYDQNNPIDGTYILQSYGTGDGPYTIDFMSKTTSENAVHHILSGIATKGKTNTYLVNISSNSTDPIQVQRKVAINVIPEKISLKSSILGVIVTGQPGFDIKDIDTNSVQLGTGGAKPLLNKAFLINDKKNLLLFFNTMQVKIAPSDKELCLKGSIKDGAKFTGCDSITVVKNPYEQPPFFNLINNIAPLDLLHIHQVLDLF